MKNFNRYFRTGLNRAFRGRDKWIVMPVGIYRYQYIPFGYDFDLEKTVD